jgi:hypothetical protein
MGMKQSRCPLCNKKHPYVEGAKDLKDKNRNARHWVIYDGYRICKKCAELRTDHLSESDK